MNGHVDSSGRALVSVSIRRSDDADPQEITAWIDTAFNGDLVLPQQQIDDMALPQSGTVKAILADGAEAVLKIYTCSIDWFGATRRLEVVANEGQFPLLGIGLLLGVDLYISYRSGQITIQ